MDANIVHRQLTPRVLRLPPCTRKCNSDVGAASRRHAKIPTNRFLTGITCFRYRSGHPASTQRLTLRNTQYFAYTHPSTAQLQVNLTKASAMEEHAVLPKVQRASIDGIPKLVQRVGRTYGQAQELSRHEYRPPPTLDSCAITHDKAEGVFPPNKNVTQQGSSLGTWPPCSSRKYLEPAICIFFSSNHLLCSGDIRESRGQSGYLSRDALFKVVVHERDTRDIA